MNKTYYSSNGVKIKPEMVARFDLKDAVGNGHIDSSPYIGTVEGDVFQDKSKCNVVCILIDNEYTITIPIEKINIPIDIECENCGEEFNEGELKVAMVDVDGTNLEERKVCPHCRSTEWVRNDA